MMKCSTAILSIYILTQLIFPQKGFNQFGNPVDPKSTQTKFTDHSEDSNLPIILIYTSGQSIPDEPKATMWMSVINNPNGLNNPDDINYEFDGKIGIEIRGSSSQMFDKKNYTIETRTDSGTNLNVSLLGMPEENDWVLHGPYSDKSLMRNVLAYHLGSLTGQWSPRTQFCELYIDDEYRGVYVLIEKIKRDKNRVNISTLNSDEISGDDITGGYLLKLDRPDFGAWTSPYKGISGTNNVYISYVEPKYSEMADEQRAYIKNYVTDFEEALYETNFTDPQNGYQAYVNIASFVDYFLINELSKNVDAYRLSAFFYKDKDSKGGRLTMGPLWDYNLAFGNCNYYSTNLTSGWIEDDQSVMYDSYQIPFWWSRLREDPFFEIQLKTRWNELRKDKFSNENLNDFIDSCATLLESAQQRNFEIFPVLNTWIWPNYYVGGSYSNELNYLKDWVNDRLDWMDSEIDLISSIEEPILSLSHPVEAFTYPNPFSESVTVKFNLNKSAKADVKIENILGQEIYSRSIDCAEGNNEFYLGPGIFQGDNKIYLYKIIVEGKIVFTGKMLKK